ncbi:beta-lactamase/transpeptidase-like protein [Lentithecium fluviatile CBS 122367]|uniref:Beta-lactamase/transpeptidase-like protein n=1 Tax=Lentithecium fluviatile CBS 122367 TaxID=1168545 RepID=A0A6G1IYK5_9PLEO|nr:beta-lactamase/transpeptidase-like protein [Lentithecium fluviatile CBS 122367]
METRLARLRPLIEELFKLSCSLGLSLGVLHEVVPVFTAHLGRREASELDIPNGEKLYNVASFTKLMAAGVVSNLVELGLLGWDVPICHYLPEFGKRKDDVGQHATIPRLACHIPAYGEFWKTFVYSTWGYYLVTSTIERVNGKPFSVCVQEYIFRPLGMSRSSTNLPGVDNVVLKHWVSLEELPMSFHGRLIAAGVRASVSGGPLGRVTTFTGYNGSMLLDPQSQSAVFILVNSLPLFDITDMLGQLLLGMIIGENDCPDYIEFPKSKRTNKPPSFPLKHYEGDYWHKDRIICYTVRSAGNNQLHVTVKGSRLTAYVLDSWGGDMFCLPPNRELELPHSMWPFTSGKSRVFTFNCSKDGVESFTWHHENTPGSKPETFVKDVEGVGSKL